MKPVSYTHLDVYKRQKVEYKLRRESEKQELTVSEAVEKAIRIVNEEK